MSHHQNVDNTHEEHLSFKQNTLPIRQTNVRFPTRRSRASHHINFSNFTRSGPAYLLSLGLNFSRILAAYLPGWRLNFGCTNRAHEQNRYGSRFSRLVRPMCRSHDIRSRTVMVLLVGIDDRPVMSREAILVAAAFPEQTNNPCLAALSTKTWSCCVCYYSKTQTCNAESNAHSP